MQEERIDKFLDRLTVDELRLCAAMIKSRLSKGRGPGRPRGRSKQEYHQAYRKIALATLRARQDWLDDNPDSSRAPNGFIEKVIRAELEKYPSLIHKAGVIKAIRQRVDKPIRVFLPRTHLE